MLENLSAIKKTKLHMILFICVIYYSRGYHLLVILFQDKEVYLKWYIHICIWNHVGLIMISALISLDLFLIMHLTLIIESK